MSKKEEDKAHLRKQFNYVHCVIKKGKTLKRQYRWHCNDDFGGCKCKTAAYCYKFCLCGCCRYYSGERDDGKMPDFRRVRAWK
jgi:hypothetical protein